MIDFENEDVFPISEGINKEKVRKSKNALWDLIRRGRKSVSGKMVYLEFCRIESGYATSVEAFIRFRNRLNDYPVRKEPQDV